MVLRRKDQSLTQFLACFKKPTSQLFISIELSQKVSFMPIAPSQIVPRWFFFLRNIILHTPQHYRWLTCYVCASLCQCFGRGGCYFQCDKPCSYNYTCTQRFSLHRSCTYFNSLGIFDLWAKIKLQKWMSNSSQVGSCDFGLGQGSGFKMRPFYKLCGYVGRG